MPITAQEKLAQLRLIRSENVGPMTFNRLLRRFGSAENAIKALPDLARAGGKAGTLKVCPPAEAEAEIKKISALGAQLIVKGAPEYPALLAEIADAPPVLTVLGNIDLLQKPALGVVGSRNASLAGKRLAETFARGVGMAGYIIVSGLARGIDAAAHRASVASGTVAVVAGGIDVVYPPENRGLYEEIAKQGAIVAESPFGMQPLARHFPRRNRIISGLAQGILVVEAAERSGSLITARMALEQNRDVFAVPGSPLDPRAGGTNKLLRDGAYLAAAPEDVLQVLSGLRMRPLCEDAPLWEGTPPEPLGVDEALRGFVMEQLSLTPVLVDDVIRAVSAPSAMVQSVLLEFEIAGRILRHPGNMVSLALED